MSGGWHALVGALSLIPILAGPASLLALCVARTVPRASRSSGTKAALLLLCLAAPLLIVSTVLAAGFLPSLLDLAGVLADNCDPDHTHHPHLCPLHPSSSIGGIALWQCALGAGWGVVVLHAAIRSLARLTRNRRAPGDLMPLEELPSEQRTALSIATVRLRLPVQLVRSPFPIAALAGILRPRIILSTTLLELLPADELTAVIQHEIAHHERKDLIAEAISGMLAACHVPVVGRWLKVAFQEAVEAACDEYAAMALGSGLAGASALLRLQRWALATRRALELPEGVAMGISGMSSSHLAERRIQKLLDWSSGAGTLAPFSFRVWGPVAGLAVLVLVASEPVHHLLEDLLGLLSR